MNSVMNSPMSCLHTVKNGRACNIKFDSITMIIDRSGSMIKIIDATINGVNQFISDQKELSSNCKFSLIVFDDIIECPILNCDILDVPTITYEMIMPRRSTSLFDAISKGIDITHEVVTSGKKTIVIMTDGEENSSRTICHEELKNKICSCKNYNFIYLGANQDAIGVANNIGLDTRNAMTFGNNSECAKVALRSASLSACRFRSGDNGGFTQLERQASMGESHVDFSRSPWGNIDIQGATLIDNNLSDM